MISDVAASLSRRWNERSKCHCWFASTAGEIRALLERHSIGLVLSTRPVTERSAQTPLLTGSKRTIFDSVPVEDGCLWFRGFLEIVSSQRLCAVWIGEFMKALNDPIAHSGAQSVDRAVTPAD
jgi:hypothetical protein